MQKGEFFGVSLTPWSRIREVTRRSMHIAFTGMRLEKDAQGPMTLGGWCAIESSGVRPEAACHRVRHSLRGRDRKNTRSTWSIFGNLILAIIEARAGP